MGNLKCNEGASPVPNTVCMGGVQGSALGPLGWSPSGVPGMKSPEALTILHIKTKKIGSSDSVKEILYHFMFL